MPPPENPAQPTDETFLRVGALARRTGLTVRTLHHYHQLGLLVPSGRSWGDHRLYSLDDLRRLLSIQHLRSLGLTLAEVRAALDDPAFDPAAVLDQHIAVVEQRLAAERDLLARLYGLRDAADTGWPAVIGTIAATARLTHSDPMIRLRTVIDTTAASTPPPLPTLVQRLATERDQAVRDVMIWAIAQHGTAAVGLVAEHLADPDPTVRASMAYVLTKVPADDAATEVGDSLVRLLDDPDDGVRRAAVPALARQGGPAGLTSLVARLGDPDERLADLITDAVAAYGDAVVAPVAQLLLQASGRARLSGIEVLARVGTAAAVEALTTYTDDPDPDVAVAALAGLTTEPVAAVEAVEAALAAALRSPHRHVRILAERISADRSAPARSAPARSAPARSAPPPPA